MENTYHVEESRFPREVTPDLGSWEAAVAECKRMNDLDEAVHGRCFAAVERKPAEPGSYARQMVRSEVA